MEMHAQKFELRAIGKDSIETAILESIPYKKKHDSISTITKETNLLTTHLLEKGFINSSLKELNQQDSIYTVSYSLGKPVNEITIYYNDDVVPKELIKKLTSNYTITSLTIDIDKVPIILNQLVNEFEKEGDSFTEIKLKNIQHQENKLTATLDIKNTIIRKIDRVKLNGYERFPTSHVKYFLNLKENKTFNTKKLENASNAIKALPFASEIKPPEVLFTKDSTIVYLYLEKTKANRFDGLIGFASDDDGGIQFNGYLDLLLNNILNKGEQFKIKWQSNADERTVFDVGVRLPYIFNTPLSPSGELNIYRQDSTFVNVKTSLNLAYTLSPQNTIAARYQSENSSDLRAIKSQINVNDYKNLFWGGSFTNRIIDPVRAYQNKFFLNIGGLWGSRTIIENSIDTKTDQQIYNFEISYNWALNYKNAIFIKNKSATLVSDNLLTNELFRIGGANSIRGFNEESILSSTHSILNVEYHYYLGQVSNIYSISDFAYINNQLQEEENNLYSFGIGYVYKTKSGLIDMSYAIGKFGDLPFDLNNSRFHIKLIQFF